MKIETHTLEIDYSSHHLPTPKKTPTLTAYRIENHPEFSQGRKRPAVLICPGGGYQITSSREGEPVALAFLAQDISAFVLHYSTPAPFPTALLQAATALALIREYAEEWDIDPQRIACCGFSAGGHLAGCTGVFWNHPVLHSLGFSGDRHRPNGLILCYPVISSGEHGHRGSFEQLELSEEHLKLVSLEHQVTCHTPPVFLWTTYNDAAVSVHNTLLFAHATVEKGISTQVHIYPEGVHGLSLGSLIVNPPQHVMPQVEGWLPLAVEFVRKLSKDT